MSGLTILIIVVVIIALLFLVLNFLLAPHNPYSEKNYAFECGFHSFLQSRLPFNISFFIYGILYLLLDLEIILIYPYAMSSYENGGYGLIIVLVFTIIVTIGFVYELGKKALDISSKQNIPLNIQSYNIAYIAKKKKNKNIIYYNNINKRLYSTSQSNKDKNY